MTGSHQGPGSRQGVDGGDMVYLVPQEAILAYGSEAMTLLDAWNVLWRGKWIVMALTTLAAVSSIAYALSATEWYRAEILLAPARENSSQGLSGAIGSLAAFTGVGLGSTDTAESVAMLTSREITREFIEEENLLPVLFANVWDAAAGAWVTETGAPPDIRDAVRYFNENVRSVSVDRVTSLVTLRIEWTEPESAARWASQLVDRLNARMRMRALKDAEENVQYLRTELDSTSLVMLQQSIGRLLETEMQKLMLAKGNEEFAFRVIDRAQPPNTRSRPYRSLIVAVATMVGGMAGVLLVLLRHSLKAQRAARRVEASGPVHS